jgi:hypothetical protein
MMVMAASPLLWVSYRDAKKDAQAEAQANNEYTPVHDGSTVYVYTQSYMNSLRSMVEIDFNEDGYFPTEDMVDLCMYPQAPGDGMLINRAIAMDFINNKENN